MARRSIESKFLTEISKSFEPFEIWYYKIPDSPVAMRFQIERPFDSICCYKGEFLAIEAKALPKIEAFGMRHLRPSQIKNLEAVTKCGGKSYVFLNVRVSADSYLGIKRENRMYVWLWQDFVAATLTGSIKAKELEKLPYIKGSNKFWDLSEFISRIDSFQDLL